MTDNQRKFRERPTMEEIVSTFFVAPDKSFELNVPQADHAMYHYHELVAVASADSEPEAACNGLMGACLAHALGWTMEQGLEAVRHNEHFQFVIVLLQGAYAECLAAGLYDAPEATLS
jgi:hypothetical protein